MLKKIFVLAPPWYNPEFCDGCRDLETIQLNKGTGAYCRKIEEGEKCDLFGIYAETNFICGIG